MARKIDCQECEAYGPVCMQKVERWGQKFNSPFSFYSVRDPSPCNGATTVRVDLLISVNPVKSSPHTHTQRFIS